MNSSPTPSSMPSQTATRGMFSFAWFDMTPILRSYLCATTASGYPPTLTSVWVKDWECGSSPRLQSNWARTSPETPKSMEMSSSFWSRVNQFVKVEFRRPLRSRGFIAICRTSVGNSTSYSKRGTAVQADVRFGSLADITTRSRHVRFTPHNGHWAAQGQHLAVGLWVRALAKGGLLGRLDRRRASFDIAFALKKVTIPGFRKALSSRAASRKLGQARLKSALCGC